MPLMQTHMIDISEKEDEIRTSTAVGDLILKKETIERIRMDQVEKGDCFAMGESAALLAVKNTPLVIPHCHPIPISKVDVFFTFFNGKVHSTVTVKSVGKTGVEIEAINGVNAALLTVWDMVKKYEKDEKGQYPNTKITDIKIVEKRKQKI
ncbi:MAG: cyclic pyranopterin monophosphate synthase MoaC [Candidatus Ranarchaeia archaeon]